jgi:hypothetical protein
MKISRLAAGVFTVLMGVAVLGVGTAWAEEQLEGGTISTTCGAGTEKECATKDIVDCEISFHFKISRTEFEFGFKESNCRVVGQVPIYKDLQEKSSLSGSCSLLNPFLGMPSGSGCS